MKPVIYDFMERPAPGTVEDGSDEMLRPSERVTPEDLASPYCGLLQQAQKALGQYPARRPERWRRSGPEE